MIDFFQSRGIWLSAVVAIMFILSLAQSGISYSMAFGPLHGPLPDRSTTATALLVLRFGLVALMATLWTLKRRRALFTSSLSPTDFAR